MTSSSFDWNPLKESLVFGATVAVCYRFDLPNMIASPVATNLVSTLGGPLARDVGTVISFGVILWVKNSWIWPNVRGYLTW